MIAVLSGIILTSFLCAFYFGVDTCLAYLEAHSTPSLLLSVSIVALLAIIYVATQFRRLHAELDQKSAQLQDMHERADHIIDERIRIIEGVKNELQRKASDLRKFELAVTFSSNQVVIANADRIIVYVNAATEHITGYSAGELLNTPVERIWKGVMTAQFAKNMWKRLTQDKHAFIAETEHQRKNGETYWAQTHITPIYTTDGDIEFFVGISRDITHHRETAILKTQLDNFFALSSDMLCIGHVDGVFTKISPSFVRILGWQQQELLKHPITFFVAPEDRAATQQAMKSLRTAGTQAHFKNRMVCADGRTVWCSWSATSIEDGIFYAIAHDVSQEEAVNKAKTEFVSLASHQLRTPLAAMGWYAEMMLAGDMGKMNKKQTECVQEIYENQQNMLELINALLNMSRLDLGTFSIDPVTTDVSEIARDVVHELTPGITKKSLRIVENYTKIPKYSVDQKLLRVVFQNLLSNAVKYTPENGTVTLTLKKVGKQAHDGMSEHDLLISVSDTGYGIPKAQQEHIFGKMFRADNVKAKAVEGTGLGLYMVKAILEASGCSIWFESTEDVGTTFYVVIPREGMHAKDGIRRVE